jgi:hypothetical protein
MVSRLDAGFEDEEHSCDCVNPGVGFLLCGVEDWDVLICLLNEVFIKS